MDYAEFGLGLSGRGANVKQMGREAGANRSSAVSADIRCMAAFLLYARIFSGNEYYLCAQRQSVFMLLMSRARAAALRCCTGDLTDHKVDVRGFQGRFG